MCVCICMYECVRVGTCMCIHTFSPFILIHCPQSDMFFSLHQQTEFCYKEHQGPFLRKEMYKSVFETFQGRWCVFLCVFFGGVFCNNFTSPYQKWSWGKEFRVYFSALLLIPGHSINTIVKLSDPSAERCVYICDWLCKKQKNFFLWCSRTDSD